MRRSNRWNRGKAAVILAAGIMLSGCSSFPTVSEVKEIKGYSRAQTMVVVATEENRYENLYTEQIFQKTLDEKGTTVEQYLLMQVKSFLEELKMMNRMAKENEVTLTSAEKELVKEISREYYDSLTQADFDYMGVELSDIETLYEDYAIANKLVGDLTKDMDMEISDSEAKVITIQQIEVWNEDTAQVVLEKLNQENANFLEVAEEYSVNPERERNMGRGEEEQALEDAAFALAEGEISGIVETGQGYYIVKCINDYHEEATAKRKEALMEEKKALAFRQIYYTYVAENPVTFDEELWNEIALSSEEQSDTENFFSLYQERMEKK